jgi:hypothetical protein
MLPKFRYVILALIAVLALGLNVSLVACGGDDDDDDDSGADVAGPCYCFVACETDSGGSFSQASQADTDGSEECNQYGQSACEMDDRAVGQTACIPDCAAEEDCAPSWYFVI